MASGLIDWVRSVINLFSGCSYLAGVPEGDLRAWLEHSAFACNGQCRVGTIP